MWLLTTSRPSPPQDDDLITNFRLNFEMYFGFATFLLLSPYVINHLLQQRLIMAAFTFAIVFLASVNSFSIFRRRIQVVPFAYFYTLILAVLTAGLVLQGSSIIYWYYPFAFIILSIAHHRQARIMLALSILVFVPAVFYSAEPGIAVRFSVTYLMVCIFGDIVVRLLDKAQVQQELLTLIDPLTGAYNRRSFLATLGDAAESCRRGIGTASLIAIDIDHFKQVNDSQGHKVGDEALKGIVSTLQKRKRKLDKIFRTGGEEFIVLAHNIEPGESIAFADSLRVAVEDAKILDELVITISIGVASYSTERSIDDWIRQADANLYEAKNRGRNRVWPPYFSRESILAAQKNQGA
ncbi:MAG: GGDEF domain-containing protein [Gammaproteobacteria bacterium]|nr:GGDEF domain-containing protein [Gammaproteobacteria bacterium]MBQ0838908.1 GGDEF domain-containing protein [Gammaproteobacteria bacterium]